MQSADGRFTLVSAKCGSGGPDCPTGPVMLEFSTPVRGADLLRNLHLLPAVKYTISDTNDVRAIWSLWGELKPRTGYVVTLEPTFKDQFGQIITGNPRATGRSPSRCSSTLRGSTA